MGITSNTAHFSHTEYMTVEDRAYFQKYFKKLCKIGVPEKRNKEDTLKVFVKFGRFIFHRVFTACYI